MKSWFILGLVLLSPCAVAQTINLQAGTSTEYGTGGINGGTAVFYFADATNTISMSTQGVSFFAQHPWHGDTLGVGDVMLPAALPTDYNPQYGFFSRGLQLKRKDSRSNWMVFVGAAETRNATSFSTAGHPQTPLSMVTYERPLSDTLTFSSFNIFSSRQTAVESFLWKRDKRLKCAASVGIGANAPLAAALCDLKTEKWVVLAGYTFAGANFRPVQLSSMIQNFTENVGFNGTLTYKPDAHNSVTVSRQNLLSPPINGVEERATVETFNATRSWNRYSTHVSASEGSNNTNGVTSTGLDVGAGVSLLHDRVHATGDFFYTNRGNLESESFTETITRHLSAMEYVNTQDHKTSMNFGGTYASNFITASVYYSDVFNPFASGIPYQQQINVRVSILLNRRITVSAGTYTTPTGEVKYEAYETAYVEGPYRGGDSGTVTHSSHGKHELDGRVTDETGVGVEGSVVMVNGTACVTDSTGSFTLRVNKTSPVAVEVHTEKFLSGTWAVVSAPATATPGTPVNIVVRRKR